MFNAEVKKRFKEVVIKREEVAKKHGVKVLSAWTSVLEHLVFYIIEAPSQTAVEDYFKRALYLSWFKDCTSL
jgi:L-rhamnose mutarotase